MELNIQSYLRRSSMEDFKGLTGLKEDYGIKYSFGTDFPELICLKYNQIESPMSEPIVQECRGIILNIQNNWEVVSRPYDKFFNYGEANAVNINWETANVYEKLDGSLMTLYFYNGKWRVQTSGTVDGQCPVNNFRFTFKELFWNTFTELNYLIPAHSDSNYCFMFELMTPYNKIVVNHTTNKLVLHGVRNIKTGEYSNINYWADKYNWTVCKSYDLNSLEETLAVCDTIDPLKQEGYIVVDKDYNRVKIKSPAYVNLHHLRSNVTPRNILEVIRTKESNEFLTYFPEYKDLYNEINLKYEKLCFIIESCIKDIYYDKLNDDYKAVSFLIKDLFYKGVVFQVLRNKESVAEVLSKIHIKKLEGWLELI